MVQEGWKFPEEKVLGEEIMMATPFFTVLMPVHNGAKYLSKAVNSILQQTFADFELVIINDCSTDDTLALCQTFVERDKRVLVYSTATNKGVANARNEALKHINGQYFTFVDADDYIDIDILAKVHAKLEETRAQLLKYGCIEEYYDRQDKLQGTKKLSLQDSFLTVQAEIRKNILAMEKLPLFGYVWNTVYSTDFFRAHPVQFSAEYNVNEDFMFNMDVFEYAGSLVCLNSCAYHYAKRADKSLSTTANPKYFRLQTVKIEKLLTKFQEWQLLDQQTSQDIYWLYTRYAYSDICRVLVLAGEEAAREEIKNIFASELYQKYRAVKFVNISTKERTMISCLQGQHIHRIINLCKMMNFVKSNFQVLFALIKG